MKLSITEFLLPFFPDENEPLFLFGYSPKELPEETKEMPNRIQTTRAELKSSRDLQANLRRMNKTQGVYFVVNAGGTLKTEINRINAFFCEIDDLPIQEQHDIFDNAPFPPSVRVETKKSVHAYWFAEEKDVSIDDFIFIQRGLIEHFKSDKAIKNQNRVMRLPFFNHIAFEQGEYLFKPVSIHTFSYDTFTVAELKDAYSPTAEPEPQKYVPQNYDSQSSDWENVFEQVRRRVETLPGYHVEHGGKLASARGVCHHGDSNRTLVVNLQTGVVFCRNECRYSEIMQALGVEPPPKREKRYTIPRVPERVQTSELYQWINEQEKKV